VATIRLIEVTKIYSADSGVFPSARPMVLWGRSSSDRAFADRMRAQASEERYARTAQAGPVRALDEVTLTVPDGKTLAVVGPSGCGKSTLLRVIAGLTEYSGDVYYDDRNMNEVEPRHRYIGMVFQNYALYPHFLSKGNLRFTFLVRHTPDEEAEERIRVTSEVMGIGFSELLGRKPGTLSGGQQQRVAVARALVRQPELMLLDEPLSNLDAKLRASTRVEIKRLLRRFGITAVYVTHDQTEAITLGDMIAVMRAGRIEQVGTYRGIRVRPANAFVAGFFGLPPMNLLRGVAEGRTVRVKDVRIPIPQAIAAVTKDGQEVTVGIHAEDVALVRDGQEVREGARVQATVECVEPDFGCRQQTVYARAEGDPLNFVAPLDVHLQVGDTATLVLPGSALAFFDTDTEARLGPL
jgi:ABC-type sugar transport system ATPase subunit